ncbi:hypothetical protein PO124_16510 [Bacillus licheniformis]|nr:hypothetical protein [Bacillus licheniformis]
MKDHYPSELPLIRANPANITEVIESVLKTGICCRKSARKEESMQKFIMIW